jgi:hypothetical protein
MKKLLAVVPVLLLAASVCHAQTATGTATSVLTVPVGAEAAIAITQNGTNFVEGAGAFANYTATTSFTYSVRTSATSGTGSISLAFAADFGPTGGPSIVHPINPPDTLSYTCTAAVGTACASATTVSALATSYGVVNFGAAAYGTAATGSVAWTLVNDPSYATSTAGYTTTATFTISAT